MADRDTQIRYLIHFSDGGAGMRYRDVPLEQGAELEDGGGRRGAGDRAARAGEWFVPDDTPGAATP